MKKLFFSLIMLFSLMGIATTVAQESFSFDPNNIYFIKNLRSAKYVQAQTGTRLTQSAQPNEDCAFLLIKAGEPSGGFTPVRLKSPKTNKFLQDVNNGSWADDENNARIWQIHTQSQAELNGYSISKSTDLTSTSDSWNDFNGSNGKGLEIDYWAAEDPGSVFAIESWTEYVDSHTFKNFIGAEAFCISASKRDQFIAGIQLTKNSTAEQIRKNLQSLAALKYTDCMNLGSDPMDCVLQNKVYPGSYLSASMGHETKALQNLATRCIWTIRKTGDEKISLQNKATGEYLTIFPDYNVPNTAVVMKAQEQELSVRPVENKYTYVNIYYNAGTQNNLAQEGSSVLVYQNYGLQYAQWRILPVSEEQKAAAVAEETKLANTDKNTIQAICDMLGVSLNTNAVTNLGDIENINSKIYETAKDNVYRIIADHEAGNPNKDKVIGVDSQNRPAGVDFVDKDHPTSCTDLSQLWRFVPSGRGFKIVNCNKQAANEPCAISKLSTGKPAPAATLTTPEDAETFYIVPSTINGRNTVQFYSANPVQKPREGTSAEDLQGGRNINMIFMERAGYPSGDYVLTKWYLGNSYFKTQKVDDIEIPLTTIRDNAWATAYLPFGVSKKNNDYTAYVANGAKGNLLLLQETTNAKACNGMILKAPAGTPKAVFKLDNTADTESSLTGTTVQKTIDRETYILSTGEIHTDVVAFYRAGVHTTLGANRVYLTHGQVVPLVRSIALAFGDTTTAIEAAETTQDTNHTLYDLSGRRVKSNAKGILIRNGKKIVIK